MYKEQVGYEYRGPEYERPDKHKKRYCGDEYWDCDERGRYHPRIEIECRCDECEKRPPSWWFPKQEETPEKKEEKRERNELAAYAYVFVSTTPSEVVAPNTDVVFTNNGPLKNVAHVPGTAAVVIEKSGAYEIFYAVSAVAGAGARIALTVNGVADQTTTLTVLATPEIVSGKVILNLRAGQILTLRNISATPITLAAAPEVGAQLTLERLGDIEDGENQRNET